MALKASPSVEVTSRLDQGYKTFGSGGVLKKLNSGESDAMIRVIVHS